MKERLITPSYCFIIAAHFLFCFGFWLLMPVLPFYLQEEFNVTYFKELIKYITIDEMGIVTLHTKTDAEIEERKDNA